MSSRIYFIVSLLGMTVFLSACASWSEMQAVLPGGRTLQLEVADTAAERELGLMGRTDLDDHSGMLFVFDEPQVSRFWMKNTLIPLDILFLDATGRVVDLQTMDLCVADPCPIYSSSLPSLYALEIPAGKAREWGVTIGDVLTLSETL